MSTSRDDQDFDLTVTVRLYGDGTAEEAAEALRNYPATFHLFGDREVEILDAKPAGAEEDFEELDELDSSGVPDEYQNEPEDEG